ncbi:MAG: fructose PTS transporter subunit IIB [Eubacterium sp.]|nr:fructose PTS transporter subunit IIB [Eubacterium sp.]
MRIIDLLDDRSILLQGQVQSKKEALDTLVDLMNASGKLKDVETYRNGVYEREKEGSTGIGEGIAIPHCKSAAVKEAGLAAMVVPEGVEFESLDGEPANLFFLITAPAKTNQEVPLILAVTGCPTGIAHTYMAAEALERKAKELGYQIKVETRGSSGAKNVLTEDEIQNATGIIVAADTKIPMERFHGKPVIHI